MNAVTRLATLDGTWELHPMLALEPVDPNQGTGFTVKHADVAALLDKINNHPGLEDDGFKVTLDDTDPTTIEFPPGEPARNVIAALRWFSDAIHAAGPMPATHPYE